MKVRFEGGVADGQEAEIDGLIKLIPWWDGTDTHWYWRDLDGVCRQTEGPT